MRVAKQGRGRSDEVDVMQAAKKVRSRSGEKLLRLEQQSQAGVTRVKSKSCEASNERKAAVTLGSEVKANATPLRGDPLGVMKQCPRGTFLNPEVTSSDNHPDIRLQISEVQDAASPPINGRQEETPDNQEDRGQEES
ncbi:hypothetical protein NDU88_002445 [Pleurodeles waltl]|uniref:Uncharacterized protein n=1 Tax=Pleurodeles waltl TaxID=8319 RepID=A0AAV7RFE5_PLEWA|nr:hypothetical protein NDU88_002445 [Pleurodeles waltl]